jgi:hypothetical protein
MEMIGVAPSRGNATAIRNLHRGGAECRAGGSDTPLGLENVC